MILRERETIKTGVCAERRPGFFVAQYLSRCDAEVFMAKHFFSGNAIGVFINNDVHVSKRGSSSYGLFIRGERYQYCCQDGCCDKGLRPDVADVVRQAKADGATRVVIRTGQRDYYVSQIEGLPVTDVSNHVGRIDDDHEIARRW
jgi:hypothetical protein